MLRPHFTSGTARRATSLLKTLKLEAYTPELPIQEDRIHVANGTLFLSDAFCTEKEFCRNRLLIRYAPSAPQPVIWLRFLSDLLEPEDVLTLQEYLGYCLIPMNRGQVMMLLKGNGGEGKSRIGVVVQKLLGSNLKNGSIAKVERSPFARADLEHELLMVDDDMKLEALKSTHYLKSLITAEMPMDLERKGEQSYQGKMYVRFLAFSNGDLESLYDHSDGFYRRQLILSVKKKPPNREDDPFLADKLCGEIEGIFLWCLEGLRRLQASSFRFTESSQTKANREDAPGGRGRQSGGAETEGVSARQVKTEKKFARRRKNFAKPRCSEPRTGFTDARGAARFRAKSRGFVKSIPLTYEEGIDRRASSGFEQNRILHQTAKRVFGNRNPLRCFHNEKTGGFYEHQK